MSTRTIADVLRAVEAREQTPRLPAPAYDPVAGDDTTRERWLLGMRGFDSHMSDEGGLLEIGLERAGYRALYKCDARRELIGRAPSTVLVQDKREWDSSAKACKAPGHAHTRTSALAERDDVFRVTVLKDAQNDVAYHRGAAEEIGAHAWVCYYSPKVVAHVAPFVRREHLVRTWHCLSPGMRMPSVDSPRQEFVVSGALDAVVYPLRSRMAKCERVRYLPHPGYHARGSSTRQFVQQLGQYKVSLACSSTYGYALRKIIESTFAGCAVITDLPEDEIMPAIDANLHRVRPDATVSEVLSLARKLSKSYDPAFQQRMQRAAAKRYDYLRVAEDLVAEIYCLRTSYGGRT